jgi:hypothetical protein
MTKNTLTFHFQRDSDDSSQDDVLKVTSADDGWVQVKYLDKTSNVKNMAFMREDGFMSYMESMLSLMKYDSSPYKFVQISAPCHPMVLISSKDLTKDGCMTTIGNVLSSCWRIWYPFTANTSTFDEDEDEDVEMDGEHAYTGCHCNQDEC